MGRLNEAAEKLDSVAARLQIDFFRMQSKPKFSEKEVFKDRHERTQIIPAVMDDYAVINITDIMTDAKFVFCKMVKGCQIEICKNLAR